MIEKLTQNNFKTMSNKVKILIGVTIFLIFSIATGAVTIYPVLDTQTRFEQYKNIYNNSNFYTGGECGFKGGYSGLVNFSDRQFFELSEFNLWQPTYVLIEDYDVSDYTGNSLVQHLSFIKFQRTGITSFKPIEEYGASVRNKTLAETIEIIKKYDLLKENPDPKNITVVPPKSPEELAKIAEQYCNQNNFDEERKKSEEEYNNASPNEKIQILEKDIAEFQKELSETTSESDKKLYLRIIEQMQTEIQRIKNEQVN